MTLPTYPEHHEWHFKNLTDFYHPDEHISQYFANDFSAPEGSSEIVQNIAQDFKGFRRTKALVSRYGTAGYCKMFERMMHIEDLTIRKALNELSVEDKTVRLTHRRHQYEINFDGKKMSEKLGFNHLVLTPMSVYIEQKDKEKPVDDSQVFLKIILIDGSRVVFEKSRRQFLKVGELYHAQLFENRVPTRLACRALECIKNSDLEPFFTTFDPTTLKNQRELEDSPVEVQEFCNPSIASSESQATAVRNIVNKTSYPSSYVVFGPPGTGKTSTLVEAIAQIVKLKPDAKILVTANSNAACDEIGERLLKFVPRYKMYRLYSSSFDQRFPERFKQIHPLLKPISNVKFDLNKSPSYEEFYSYTVVISTLVNCGRIVSANIRSDHFDYIFIDECASTIEPMSIIPIALLGASCGRINAQVVLAGDHKQLQGLVHSYFNEKNGFGISLMERVMMLGKYQFPYDPHYVTQLTDNFRSHWAILRFSNLRFYHSVLEAKQTPEIANFAIDWDLLPNKNFPLIFHSILAPSEMDGTSLFNNEEVHVVASYVNSLLKEGISGQKVEAADIGIICPYGAQRKKLQNRFNRVNGLEIGTVDSFQGREKLIIVLSTVRSQTPTIGFLKNEKRLNVALTRAKALLIVVGNGETLQLNKMWYKFLNFCFQNNAMVGEKFMLRYRKSTPSENKIKKPHPMFQLPKVPLMLQDFIEWRLKQKANKVNLINDNSTDDGIDDHWVSDSDASDSDVSWTHEDFRLKAKTSKYNQKAKDVAAADQQTANKITYEASVEELTTKVKQMKIQDFKA